MQPLLGHCGQCPRSGGANVVCCYHVVGEGVDSLPAVRGMMPQWCESRDPILTCAELAQYRNSTTTARWSEGYGVTTMSDVFSDSPTICAARGVRP